MGPHEVLQNVMNWLPAFQDRVRLCHVCIITRSLKWRLAPPHRLDEELSGRSLGDTGSCAVARALTRSPNMALGELCLGSNGIGDTGARAIATALGTGSALRRLSL